MLSINDSSVCTIYKHLKSTEQIFTEFNPKCLCEKESNETQVSAGKGHKHRVKSSGLICKIVPMTNIA